MSRPSTLPLGSIEVRRPTRAVQAVPILGDALGMAAALAQLAPVPPARAISADALGRIERRLRGDEERLILRMGEETGYQAGECQRLLAACRRFLRHLPALPGLHAALAADETERYAELAGGGAHIELAPWGTCLVCIPSAAPAPLALTVPLALVAAGNRVAVAASDGSRSTALGLAAMVAEEIGGVSLWSGRVRDALAGLLATGALDLVYFLGGAAPYASVAGACARAGVELVYEGEAGSLAVLDDLDPASWRPVIESLVGAKASYRGRMASSPRAIAVPRALATAFEAAWRRAARGLREESELRLVRGTTLGRALDGDRAGPGAHLLEYDDWDALARELGAVRRRLQLSLFSPSEDKVRRMIGATRFARYSVNQGPIEQDPLLPRGSYGLGGHADVLDLYRKGLRRVVVERGGLLST